MSFANILLLAALQVATIASAQTHRFFPGMHVESIGELIPRRLYDNASECTIRDTCGECFGFGYVLCDNSGCFNPDDGEQCCKDGCMFLQIRCRMDTVEFLADRSRYRHVRWAG